MKTPEGFHSPWINNLIKIFMLTMTMTMMIDDDDGDDDDDADDDDDDDDDDKGHQFMMSTRISEFLTPSVHMRPLVDIHVPST